MRTELGFAYPEHLYLPIAAALLALLWARFERQSWREFGRWGLAVAPSARWLARGIFLLAILFALLRPYAGYEDVNLRTKGKDVLAIVDVSNSMLAADVKPSRLAHVKRKLLDLVRMLREAGQQDRLGIVVFAGEAKLFAPLTADYAVLRDFINAISTELIVQGGSELGAALELASKSLAEVKSAHPLQLVFTDGGNGEIPIAALHESLRDAQIPAVFFGVGTPQGSSIEVLPGEVVRDSLGQVVTSRLNESALQTAASESGGIYLRARLDDGDLSRALTLLRELQGGRAEEAEVRVYREIGPLILKTLLMFILLLAVFGRRAWVLPLLTLFAAELMSIQGAFAEPDVTLHGAWEAYQSGDYEAAQQRFEQALADSPSDSKVLQALASAEFKLGNYSAAEKHFAELAAKSRVERERFEALYNLGNSELAQSQYDKAISSYESALRLRPNDEKAAHNLEVAKRKQSSSSHSSSAQSQASAQSEDSSRSQPRSDASQSESSSASSAAQSDSASSGGEGKTASSRSSSEAASSSKESRESLSSSAAESASSSSGLGASESASMSVREAPLPQHDPEALKERQAKAWLESLPDAPMIPRRDNRRRVRQELDTW